MAKLKNESTVEFGKVRWPSTFRLPLGDEVVDVVAAELSHRAVRQN